MKKALLFLTMVLFFVGCAQKVNIANLSIDPSLVKHEYNTYDISEEKITSYFFSNKNGVLQVKDAITFVPVDVYGDMYEPMSLFALRLRQISTEPTLQKALEKEVIKRGYHKLFTNKTEYLIDNNFALNARQMIQAYNRKIENREEKNKVNLNLLLNFGIH